MTLWLKSKTRLACKLAQTTCISAVLAAALSGCNEEKTPVSGSTFDVPASTTVTTGNPKEEPIKGTVTIVPGTEPEKLPQIGGGLPIPLAEKVGRFTEIAPDTAGGATFRSSPEMYYDLGNLVASKANSLTSARDDEVFISQIVGWMHYPQDPISPLASKGRFPVIIFEHGVGPDESYKGCDYLAEELAAHGYVVFSVDADAANDVGENDGQARAQLILGTLDRLRQVDKNGQVNSDGSPGALDVLKGKLDFTRVGIMGHSRGGQGVSSAIKYNQTRVGVGRNDLTAAFLVAHTYEAPTKRPRGAPEGPQMLDANYPDLAAAFIPAIPFQPAVEEKPASVDEVKFMEIIKKYNGAIGASSIESMKAALISDAAIFDKVFPDLKTAIIPGVLASPVVAPVPASIDNDKFDAAIEKYNIFYAAGRETITPYDFKGAFMLAPMDNNGNLGVNNVPLANLVPACDGDVNDLAGAASFDHNRFGPITDTAPRYQIFVKGANHDFYNRQWGNDGDYGYCSLSRAGSIRLSRPDQERNGLFLINSFMRYHVGGEQKFAAYWSGTAQLPKEACEEGKKTCDERVVLTIQKDVSRRKLIARFERDNSIDRNELDGITTLSGFDASGRYPMVWGGGYALDKSNPARLPDFEYDYGGGAGFQSVADQLEVIWSKPDASIVTDLTGLSAKRMDSLTFRIGVVRPTGQEVLVTLTDSAGKSSTLTASDFSDALYNAPRPKADGRPLEDHPDDVAFADEGHAKGLMNMVAIPLKAFEGVDTNNLKELKLVFPKESGKVAITDIELQNLGRDKPAQKLAGK
jgi:dienelactone hydrolase